MRGHEKRAVRDILTGGKMEFEAPGGACQQLFRGHNGLVPKKKLSSKTVKTIDDSLEAIIDQWYLSVSDYYVTIEKKAENASIEVPEELKRFHDELGHRIKFDKGDLNFTYGLSVDAGGDGCRLEASVNTKVPNFNYGELVRRLSVYYESARSKNIEGFKKARKIRNCDIFVLPEDLQKCIALEQRPGKADIIRLSFMIDDNYLEDVIGEPANLMELIHQYCVAPLRRVYAEVYRIKRR